MVCICSQPARGLEASCRCFMSSQRPSPDPSPADDAEASNAALRFSSMGYVAVAATILVSGLVNAWLLVGSFANLVATPYGQLLIVKLCLFGGMLALAALNRFWLVPSLIREDALRGPAAGLSKFRGHILGEQAFGFLIILLVSAIGIIEPAINNNSTVSAHSFNSYRDLQPSHPSATISD